MKLALSSPSLSHWIELKEQSELRYINIKIFLLESKRSISTQEALPVFIVQFVAVRGMQQDVIRKA